MATDQYCSNIARESRLLDEYQRTKTQYPYALALQSHYQLNRHHPEHFNRISDMEPLDIQEMVCDHLACVCGPRWRDGLACTIGEAANFCKRFFPKWRGDFYPLSYDERDLQSHVRWPKDKFPDTEKHALSHGMVQLSNNELTLEEFRTMMMGLESVRFYCFDLWWHKKAIRDIAILLFPDNIDLHERALAHDDDKWDPVSVAAYTLKWIFDNE